MNTVIQQGCKLTKTVKTLKVLQNIYISNKCLFLFTLYLSKTLEKIHIY